MGERILAELRAAGIPDQVAAYVGDLGGVYVGGIAYELDMAPPGDQAAEMAARLAAWMKSLPRDRYPNTVALADKLVAGTAEDRFEWGLDLIVRGLASYLDKPPGAHQRAGQPTELPPNRGSTQPLADRSRRYARQRTSRRRARKPYRTTGYAQSPDCPSLLAQPSIGGYFALMILAVHREGRRRARPRTRSRTRAGPGPPVPPPADLHLRQARRRRRTSPSR